MSTPSPEKLAEWKARAAKKNAIVPGFFEVFPTRVILRCGRCATEFQRNLIANMDEPVFVCPKSECATRNWVPIQYERA